MLFNILFQQCVLPVLKEIKFNMCKVKIFILSHVIYLFCSGFVRGHPNTVPELVTFQQNFKKGALLTVVSVFAFE